MVRLLFLFISVLLGGCSQIGYKARGPHPEEAALPCQADCEGKHRLCPPEDTACLEELPRCLEACERWSGLRAPEGGQWTIDLPPK